MMYFTGDGSQFWPGVPMRDLSTEEWEALPEATRKALTSLKLFSKRRPAEQTAEGEPVELVKTDDLGAPAAVQESAG